MFNNERDIEVPFLVAFIAGHSDRIHSLLDIGAHYSHAYYAPQVRRLVNEYHGIDIEPDEKTAEILDSYFVGNVIDFDLPRYDCVIAVSTLEHCGISTYQVEDYQAERDRMFLTCLGLAWSYVWLSFPVGLPYFLPGEFANITEDTLIMWRRWATDFGWNMTEQFFYLNDDNRGYRRVEPAIALSHEYDLSRIQQSFCIMSLRKEQNGA